MIPTTTIISVRVNPLAVLRRSIARGRMSTPSIKPLRCKASAQGEDCEGMREHYRLISTGYVWNSPYWRGGEEGGGACDFWKVLPAFGVPGSSFFHPPLS